MAGRDRDVNLEAAGALRDLALVYSSEHARVAFRRAARAILQLDRPVDEVARAGKLREIRYIGPSSERIILEVLEHGESPTLERAAEETGERAAVEQARALRAGFLSRAEALRVIREPRPGVVDLSDYRGDLQMHSTWSDGGDPVLDLAEAAMARGHAYAAITDHSYGLRIAGGLSMEEVARQQEEIDAVNEGLAGRFRVIAGIEANIAPDGSLDLHPHEVSRFEMVLAAPHSALRKSEDQTARMLAAVRRPGVHVLAHPRGRMITRRGVLARWDEVFAEAARLGVAVELDGDPWRQDLDHALARVALGAGCLFALDSDAHAGDQLFYSEFALAHARLAGIPAERVVNAWPLGRLLAWARDRASPSNRRRPSVMSRAEASAGR